MGGQWSLAACYRSILRCSVYVTFFLKTYTTCVACSTGSGGKNFQASNQIYKINNVIKRQKRSKTRADEFILITFIYIYIRSFMTISTKCICEIYIRVMSSALLVLILQNWLAHLFQIDGNMQRGSLLAKFDSQRHSY